MRSATDSEARSPFSNRRTSSSVWVARATQTLEEVRRLEKGDLASLSVALRTLRGVVRSSS